MVTTKPLDSATTPKLQQTDGVKTAILVEGDKRVLDVQLKADRPAAGVVIDGTAILQPHMGNIDAARTRLDVSGLEGGQEYKLISLAGLKGDGRIALDLEVNVDLVPKGSSVIGLHLPDNRVPLSAVNLGGKLETVAGNYAGVHFDNYYI